MGVYFLLIHNFHETGAKKIQALSIIIYHVK
jgi:hypothetical protein